MNEDVRDDRLTGLLDAAVRGIEPSTESRLAEVLRRGGRRRVMRWTAIGTALVVFLGAVAWGAANVGHERVQPIDVASWNAYHDPGSWTARYPSAWHLQPFYEPHQSSVLPLFEGAFFSNIEHRFRHPVVGSGFTTGWEMYGLPKGTVVVELESGAVLTSTLGPHTPMPLSLSQNAILADGYQHIQMPVIRGHGVFRLNVWFFAGASQRDRQIAALIVHSITFLPDTTDWAKAGSLGASEWTFAYPPGWTRQDLPACPNAPDRTGAVVTNVDFTFRDPQGNAPGCEDRLDLNDFPSDGVAVALEPVGVRFGLAFPEPDTPLPISWDQLVPAGEAFAGPPEDFLSITVKTNLIMMLRTWIGPRASPTAVEDVKAIIASLDVKNATHWTTYDNADEGFSVTYPDVWFRAASSLTPVLASPTEILSLGTYPLQPGGKACLDAFLPGNSLADLGLQDVFITVQETSPEGMPPRPATIGPDSATVTVDGLPACDPYKALQLTGWWIPFADQGHGFYVFVAAGPFAANDQQTMAIVWHVVNSLRFAP